MGLIFYELLTIPFKISFDLTISETLDHCVDAMFLTDILISFNTAYYSKGTPVLNTNLRRCTTVEELL
jgi:hyperpolarization activated cyclic nucleotide-gated potassium channel 2